MSDSTLDPAMQAMRDANSAARLEGMKGGMTPDEQNTFALKHFVTDGNPYQREGSGLSEYLSGLDESGVQQPRGMYADAVNRSLDRPVISAKAASYYLGHMPQADENGFITPRQFLQGKADAVAVQFLKQFKATGRPITDNIVRMAAERADAAAAQTDDVAGLLAGTLKTNTPGVVNTANELRRLVSVQTPSGFNASPAHRTESEDAALRKEFGHNAEFMLTEGGRQNHEAQRVAELWSAQDENYLPAGTMAQVQRAAAPIFAAPYNLATGNSNRLVGEPWDDMAMISRPDGKLEYAAHMYNRSAADEGKTGPVNVYTPEGRAKFGAYDVSGHPAGLMNAMSENQSYRLAWMRQNVGYPVMEMATHIGNWQAGGDSNHLDNIRGLRQGYNRVTPVVPDHIDPQKFKELGEAVNQSTHALTGFPSAYYGPKAADAYNATVGKLTGPTERTYLSPAAQTVIETPAEMVADPMNLAFNAVVPVASGAKHAVLGAVTGGAKGAVSQGGTHLIRSLAKAPGRFMDDFMDETLVEGPSLNAATSSVADYFSPEKDNLLMGKLDPNTPGFDQKVDQAATNARQQQMEAAQEYGRLMGKKPSPYKKTSATTNIPWLLSR